MPRPPERSQTQSQPQSTSPDGSKAARKQWSSCDACRNLKKKCDARECRDRNIARCSRCVAKDIDCTFDFLKKKDEVRIARRRLSMAAKLDAARPAPVATHFPAMQCDNGGGSDYGDSIFATGDFDYLAACAREQMPAPVMTFPEISDSTPTTHGGSSTQGQSSSPDTAFDTGAGGLSERDIDEILFPELARPGSLFPDDPALAMLSGTTFGLTFEGGSPSLKQTDHVLVSTRTVSGLDAAHELKILQEFAVLAFSQLPILDIDKIFLRYRFSIPSPLPSHLLLAMLSCGAHYSSRRMFNPAIDGRRAQEIYELAKAEILRTAVPELSVDAVSTLLLTAFHWHGEMFYHEVGMLADLSVHKIQSMKLHTNEGLRKNRTTREIGLLKYLVWLNYIVDAFANSQGVAVGELGFFNAKAPYNNQSIQIDPLNLEDTESLRFEYLTGNPRPGFTAAKAERSLIFHRAFAGVAKLQNLAVQLQRAGRPIQHLTRAVQEWEASAFPVCDLTKRRWNHEEECFYGWDTLTPGAISLNFSFWYCALNIYFNDLRKDLQIHTMHATRSSRGSSGERPRVSEGNVIGAVRSFTSMITVFEVLYRANYIRRLSQVLRGQLYFGGRILQVFYKNGVTIRDRPAVDGVLLSRWEKCLEMAEQIWGYSSKGLEMSLMSLDDDE